MTARPRRAALAAAVVNGRLDREAFIFCERRATVRRVSMETAARPRLLRLTQARIGDTLHDGNGTVVARGGDC